MTDTQVEMQQYLARMFEVNMRAWADPELAAARSTATPQPMYADLMQRCPVRDVGNGVYSLLRMDDIRFLNRHPAVEQGSKYLGSDRPAIPLGIDGEDHKKYRRLLDPVFAPKRVAALADKVETLAVEMIDRFIADREVDAYAAWCEPLPSTIFLSIMGLPMDSLDDFLHFKSLILANEFTEISPEEKVARAAEGVAWIHQYFAADLATREQEAVPRDDMIGWLLTTEVEGERLTRQEILDILGLLMIAGLDTVAASLACFLVYFANHPEDRARVVADPGLLPSAVEELMRFESPVTDGYRIVTEDLELPSGAKLPAGAWVHVSWSAANLDPDAFPDPLTVDFERKPNAHIGFANGPHRCLGSHLARMEMVVALRAWHSRIPDYAIKPGAQLVFSGNPRAPHRLPLVWS